jgi:hypothetical protein
MYVQLHPVFIVVLLGSALIRPLSAQQVILGKPRYLVTAQANDAA